MKFIRDNSRRAIYDSSRNTEKLLTKFKEIPMKCIREVY